MKLTQQQIVTFLFIVLCQHGQAQGTFQNLDFESADLSGYLPAPEPNVPITSALPGWSGYYSTSTSTNSATQVGYDLISLGGALISVIDSNAPVFHPLQGIYSAFLFGGGPAGLTSATISQTGLVPAGTESLLFDAYVAGASFIVTLGGQIINMTQLQTFSNYALYGGNIPSTFAGQTETLSLTEPPPIGVPPSFLELDNIQFSNSFVPEPSTLALSALGALLLGWRARGRRQ